MLLAVRAEKSGTGALAKLLNRAATAQAGFATAAIDEIGLLEVARLALAIHEIPQGTATSGNGSDQGVLYRGRQQGATRLRQTAGGETRIDAGVKQGFVRVDIADADDLMGIHEQVFDGRCPTIALLIQTGPIEIGSERFHAEGGKKRMPARIIAPQYRPETAWIPIAQQAAILQQQIKVVMFLGHGSGIAET